MGSTALQIRLSPVIWALATLATLSLPASANQWLRGDGLSCDQVCRQAGRLPVSSGIFQANGHPFFVCAANTGGYGSRPGFNLRPSWSSDCMVGAAGREVREPRYSCLCN